MKTDKKRSFKGAVLFTVVSVMSLLIVFLTSTLVLATAANNRAHKSYASSQANYTARTAVDSVLEAVSLDESFANAVKSVNSTNRTLSVTITLDEESAGMGKITDATVKYEGTKKYFNTSEKKWTDHDILSITATVLYAGETKTVTSYIMKDPPVTVTSSGGGGGFVTVGSAVIGNHTNSFGGTYLGVGMSGANRFYAGTHPVLGEVGLDQRLYLNVSDGTSMETLSNGKEGYDIYKDAKKNNEQSTLVPVFQPGNPQAFEAPTVINGNFYVANKSELIFPVKGTGMAIWGNMSLNNSFTVSSENVNIANNLIGADDETKKLAIEKFSDIPYIYVDGELGQCQATTITFGNDTLPLNMFCGSVDLIQADVHANIYCMDADRTSKLGSNSTTLYSFSSSVINQTENLPGDLSGNFYTKGSAEIKKARINGAVKAEKVIDIDECTVQEDVVAGENLSIKNSVLFGDVVCGGDLYIDNNTRIYGSVSCKGNMTIEPNAKIFGTINNDLHIGNVVKKIKDGYEYVSNEFHYDEPKPGYAKVEYTVRWGYSEYANVELGEGPFVPEWTAEYNGATITLPDGTKMSTNNNWNPVFIVNGAFYDYKPYEKVGNDGNPTGEIVNYDYSYYRSDGSQCDVNEAKGDEYYRLDEWGNYSETCSKDEAWSDVGYYIRPDGTVINANSEDAGVTFYNSSTHNMVSASEALDETTVQGVDDSLFDEIYPRKAEKAVILGLEEIGDGTPISDSKILKTINEIEDEYKFETDSVTAIPADDTDATKLVTDKNRYTDPDSNSFSDFNIKGDCTLAGGFNHKDIVIEAQNSDTWVRLESGFKLDNGARIVYDDTTGSGELKLFIEGNVTTSGSGASIITKSYDQALFHSTDSYQINTYDDVKKVDGATDLAYPRITIYSRKPNEGEANPSLSLGNLAIVTASIEAPYLDFGVYNANESITAHEIYYNGKGLLHTGIAENSTKRIGVIGTLNVAKVTEAQNNWDFLYVPKNTSGIGRPITSADSSGTRYVPTYYEGF